VTKPLANAGRVSRLTARRVPATLDPDPSEGGPHPLLTKAAGEVTRGWAQALGEAFDADETSNIMHWLACSIDAAMYGHAPERNDQSSALTRFLLERMATVVLALIEADQQIDRVQAIRLLKGVDVVRRAIEPDWDQYFSSQLSGPDGLNLVVEVAHDIRSPLTSIRCLAETLERGNSGEVTDVQRKQLRLIYSAALGLSSMATDVIEMARHGDRPSEQDPVPFSVAETIESVIDMVRPIAEEKGLKLRFTSVPSDQRLGRPIALSRVLLNLTTNALKFTDEGGVEIVARATGLSRVEFSIQDTGRGISDDAMGTLYKPFRRSSGRLGRSGFFFSGTGLGLAMCRKLLGAMDSRLEFETAPGSGTRFFFELELPSTGRL
jgi:signal transduction histidine kinase